MKRAMLLLILGLASLPTRADELAQWFTDANAAQAKAKQENKSVLLDFTGSDWCGWCMKLKREVFDQPEFAEFARENLVLVEVDFPRHTQLDDAQRQANERLAETYHITGYPTIILLDADGRQVGQSGYREGGPRAYNANLARILKLDSHKAREPASREEPPRKARRVCSHPARRSQLLRRPVPERHFRGQEPPNGPDQ